MRLACAALVAAARAAGCARPVVDNPYRVQGDDVDAFIARVIGSRRVYVYPDPQGINAAAKAASDLTPGHEHYAEAAIGAGTRRRRARPKRIHHVRQRVSRGKQRATSNQTTQAAVHEALLASEYRTLNPDAATLFFVPYYKKINEKSQLRRIPRGNAKGLSHARRGPPTQVEKRASAARSRRC